MFQHRTRMLQRDPGEPLDELVDRGVIFQILEKRGHRDTGAAKDPRTTHTSGVSFNGRACGPVDHIHDASTGGLSTHYFPVTARTAFGFMLAIASRVRAAPLTGDETT